MAVGAIEPRFYAAPLEGLGLHDEPLPRQHDKAPWPALRERFAAIFRQRPRDDWTGVFDGTEACVSPIVSLAESAAQPHLVSRGSFVEVDGAMHPAPAPGFSRTRSRIGGAPVARGAGSESALADWGVKRPAQRGAGT